MDYIKVNEIRNEFSVNDKVYIKAGETIYNGVISEITEEGFWLTEDRGMTFEFVSFLDLINWEFAIE